MKSSDKDWVVRRLGPEHNDRMLEIVSSAPIEAGGLVVLFDKRPTVFDVGRQKCDPSFWVGLFVDGVLVGFAMRGYHRAMVAGVPTTVAYLGHGCLDREWRGFGLLEKISDALFREGMSDDVPFFYSIVMRGNRAAERHIGQRSLHGSSVPDNCVVGTFDARTVVVTLARRARSDIVVRPARAEDVGAIVALLQAEHRERLLGLVVDEQLFTARLAKSAGLSLDDYVVALEHGRIVGVAAARDCSSFKQTRVIRYRPSMWPVVIACRAMTPLIGLPPVPRAGEPLRELYLTDVAIAGRRPQIMEALFTHLYNRARQRGYNTIVFGSAKGDPLLSVTDGYLTQSVQSHLVMGARSSASLDELTRAAQLPFIDFATV